VARFDKAHGDLLRWRDSRDAILAARSPSPELACAICAVDAAFKAEVLEFRIRRALYAQVMNEAEVSRVQQHETMTGQHSWDFDWWLTESTMRATDAGVDAIAQLLNLGLELGANAEATTLPMDVAKILAGRSDTALVSKAVQNLRESPECCGIRAFVNYVKHAGFPDRTMHALPSDARRITQIEQFVYRSDSFGPWTPDDIDSMLDGWRLHATAVIDALVRATTP